jgi:transcriptional regulator with XRE-family HTH domain
MFAPKGIREIRERRGMPLAELARRADLSRGTVYAAESGAPSRLDTLVRIARELEVSLREISPDAADALAAVA